MFKSQKKYENIIFISYNIQDSDVADKISEMIKSIDMTSIDIYRYNEHNEGGRNSVDKIKKAIKNSNAMVVLLTDKSINSSYINQEIGFAICKGKPVIPFVQSDIPNLKENLEEYLGMLIGIERIHFDIKNPKKGLEELRNSLDKLKRENAFRRRYPIE